MNNSFLIDRGPLDGHDRFVINTMIDYEDFDGIRKPLPRKDWGIALTWVENEDGGPGGIGVASISIPYEEKDEFVSFLRTTADLLSKTKSN